MLSILLKKQFYLPWAKITCNFRKTCSFQGLIDIFLVNHTYITVLNHVISQVLIPTCQQFLTTISHNDQNHPRHCTEFQLGRRPELKPLPEEREGRNYVAFELRQAHVNEAKSVAGISLVAIFAICCPSKRASLEQFGH